MPSGDSRRNNFRPRDEHRLQSRSRPACRTRVRRTRHGRRRYAVFHSRRSRSDGAGASGAHPFLRSVGRPAEVGGGMNLKRSSPVHDQLAPLQPQWEERHGMSIASRVAGDDAAKLDTVALADLSYLPRFGLKGPAAGQWLESRNIVLPAKANGWILLAGPGGIAKLG